MNERLYYITINPDDWTTCGIYQGNKDDLSFVIREGLDTFHSSDNGKKKWAWTCDKDKAIGMYRDETTLEPVWYYDKTPVRYDNPEHIKVFILDPMLATGNSAHAAVSLFLKKGILIENLVFISILSAPNGIELLTRDFPDLKIITAKIDEGLNSRGYIIPGLGDAGDRLFNTFEK